MVDCWVDFCVWCEGTEVVLLLRLSFFLPFQLGKLFQLQFLAGIGLDSMGHLAEFLSVGVALVMEVLLCSGIGTLIGFFAVFGDVDKFSSQNFSGSVS